MIDLDGVSYSDATEVLYDYRTIMQKPKWWAETSKRKSEEDISSLREWNLKTLKLEWSQDSSGWREPLKDRMMQRHGFQVTKDAPGISSATWKLLKG